jgi:hypothetical protein
LAGELAVPARSDAEKPDEGAAHSIHASESGGRGDLLQPLVRALELTARGLDPHLQHVLRGARAHLAREYALEVSNAHRHPIREIFHGKTLRQVIRDPDLELADRGHLGSLRGEGNAQLRLSARPAEEQHQLASGFVRETGSAILLHPGEGEVDARGNPGGSVDVPILDPEGFVLDPHLGISPGELPAELPVGGRPPSVEETRLREQKRADADRTQAADFGRFLSQPGGKRGVTNRSTGETADQEHGVARAFDFLEMVPGDEGEDTPLPLHGQAVRGSDHFYGVDGPSRQAIDGMEDLERADQIELIDGRHGHHDNPAARPGFSRFGDHASLHYLALEKEGANPKSAPGGIRRIFVANGRPIGRPCMPVVFPVNDH